MLGANDGLLSNFSLVMGVAGADLSGKSVLITGVAGLLAGACSMAIGEWLSVQSARELYQSQIEVEKQEVDEVPDEEAEELALIYQAKGLPEDEAQMLAKRLITDKASALDTMAREELGIDPEELGGSAGAAAGASFCLFALGAIIPVAPFFFLSGLVGVIVSICCAMVAHVWHRRWNYLADWTERFLLRNEAGHFRIARGRDHFRPRTGDRHFLRGLRAIAFGLLVQLLPLSG